MGLFDNAARVLGRKMTSVQTDIWRDVFGSRTVQSGVAVNWRTALEVSTVMACGRVIGDGIAQVPFRLYRAQPGRREVAVDHPVHDLLYRRPNARQTSFEFREQIALHLLLTGNAFIWKGRVGNDRRLVSLEPIEPGLMRVEELTDGSLRYRVQRRNGTEYRDLPADDIWHIRGPSWNGWMGLEAVRYAREAIGLAIATERAHALHHRDGLKVAGVYSIKDPLTAEQHAQLTTWLREHAAADNADPLILDRGAEWMNTQMSGVDAEHLATRRFQVEEICRAFRIMPIMVGLPGAAGAYDNGEQMFIAHVTHTLMPWYERIEQSADVNLLTDEERRQGYYTKFTAQALMRGTAKERAEYYARALGSGGHAPWMTQDEVREREEMDPYGEHAGELGQSAMKPASQEGSNNAAN